MPVRMDTQLWPDWQPEWNFDCGRSDQNFTCFVTCSCSAVISFWWQQNMFVWGPLNPWLIYVHLMCQLRLDLQHMLLVDQCNHCLNPSILMTWSDEDYIGRVSRICRRTHALAAPSRCIDRALGFYRRQWASVFGEHYLRLSDFWGLGSKKISVLSLARMSDACWESRWSHIRAVFGVSGCFPRNRTLFDQSTIFFIDTEI